MREPSEELRKFGELMKYIDCEADEARSFEFASDLSMVLTGTRVVAIVGANIQAIGFEKPHYLEFAKFAMEYVADSFGLPEELRPNMEGVA